MYPSSRNYEELVKTMKYYKHSQILTSTIALMIFFGAVQTMSAQSSSSRNEHTLKAGTTIDIRLQSGLNSGTSRVGDAFKAVTMIPVFSSTGATLIPAGSRMTGRVSSVSRAGRRGTPGTIGIEFRSITLPNGRVYKINGSPVPSSSGNTSVDNEGTVSADKTSNRGLVFVGSGAAGGAVLGGIAGGGSGAAIGAGVGAVTGAITGNRSRGREAEVKSGTEFAVYLNRDLTLPRFAEKR